MAQWTFIDPNTLLPGDPWTSAKAQAAFENLEAVIKSAPGAPRPVTLDSYFAQGGSNLLSGLGPGSIELPANFFFGSFGVGVTTSTSFQSNDQLTITERATGTLRFQASQTARRTSTGGAGSEIRLLRNGVTIQSWTLGIPSTETTVSETRVVDLPASAGNVFEWQIRCINVFGNNPGVALGTTRPRADDTVENFGLWAKRSEVV